MTTDRADAPLAARALPPSAVPPSAVPRPAAAVGRPPRGPVPKTLPPPRPGRGLRRRTVASVLAADCLATAGAALPALGTAAAPAALTALVPAALLLHCRAGLYRPGPAPRALNDLPRVLGRAAVLWCAAAAVLAAVHPGRALPPVVLSGAVAAHTLLVCGGRATVYRARRNAARRRPRAALIVGSDPAARQLAAVLDARPEYGMRPVGLVPPGPLLPGGPAAPPARGGLPRLTSVPDLARAVIQHTVRDVVFTLPPYGDPHTAALLRRFVDQGSAIWLAGPAAAREGRPPHPGTDQLWGFACRRLDTAPPRHGGRRKRALDLALAAPALVVAAPLLLGCALAVRIADGPGVLCRQERTGRGGRGFTLLTFRTVRGPAAQDETSRRDVADDGRTSPVGRLLRRTALEGLPQLWNVLRGDMSLVGPCPEHPRVVQRCAQACPEYDARHRMRPGLTGLAQVHGLRGGACAEDLARFDNLYIDSWSPWQDIHILLRTAASPWRRERG
ncbi:Sugar transferase involved in LPS biosynthesis (colanic, teichoic acid) [Streptomyces sp. 2112.3]|uniref:sugar transferase n=1 Tax=Streptomyces sp. 2112.3 TaxID=1881023 RepID=UPI0008994904|nr:sugar transferase [Streptomyces sp. 2112.3]SEE95732.1 Sugar transferase involved in LPS biosynthesis (colanic, teichoic acid) [Streptomyces sp. 2112.3]